MASLLEGGNPIEAANAQSVLKPREWMRIGLACGGMLSLPIEGGASALKNRPSDTWRLAREAKREGRKISSTLATIYGRTPFFHLLEDDLKISDCEEGTPASQVCMQAFSAVVKILNLSDPALLSDLRTGIANKDGRLKAIGSRLDFHPSLSIIDAVVRLGPDAIFPLLPAFY